jgi:hypothetical protein
MRPFVSHHQPRLRVNTAARGKERTPSAAVRSNPNTGSGNYFNARLTADSELDLEVFPPSLLARQGEKRRIYYV